MCVWKLSPVQPTWTLPQPQFLSLLLQTRGRILNIDNSLAWYSCTFDRQSWECGSPDYMGSASFENILKKIDSTIKEKKEEEKWNVKFITLKSEMWNCLLIFNQSFIFMFVLYHKKSNTVFIFTIFMGIIVFTVNIPDFGSHLQRNVLIKINKFSHK